MYENMELYGPSERRPEKCERSQFGGKPVFQALRTGGELPKLRTHNLNIYPCNQIWCVKLKISVKRVDA